MRREDRVSLLFALTTAAFAVPARADPFQNVETRVAPACESDTPRLERRLAQVFDDRTTDLTASVSIETSEAGYLVSIALRGGRTSRGTTRIAAPTCDEAVDAAVEVIALALSEKVSVETPPNPSRTDPPDEHAASASAARSESTIDSPFASKTPSPVRVDRGGRGDSERSSVKPATTRVSFGAGVDMGTLPDPAAIVAGGFTWSLSALEVGGVVRYAPPTTNETVESEFTESVQRDFGSLELRACYGAGERVRFSACTGAELGAVRVVRRLRTEDGNDQDEDSVTPRLSATLAALFAHRGGVVEPELEVAGAAVALGRDTGDPWLTLRVAAGAAVPF